MERDIELEFKAFILQNDHPCVMAQSAFEHDQVMIKDFGEMRSLNAAQEIIEGLEEFLRNFDTDTKKEFYSFIAVFPQETIDSEIEFEKKLWMLLNQIHKLDESEWDNSVSKDPKNNDFSFSISGRAFYIVGMHPNSSRLARQSPYPSIAFNLHSQFEKLREDGVFKVVRNKIRQRDKARQGTINPMLKDFGSDSEAKQYSGRAVKKDWKCPFHSK